MCTETVCTQVCLSNEQFHCDRNKLILIQLVDFLYREFLHVFFSKGFLVISQIVILNIVIGPEFQYWCIFSKNA